MISRHLQNNSDQALIPNFLPDKVERAIERVFVHAQFDQAYRRLVFNAKYGAGLNHTARIKQHFDLCREGMISDIRVMTKQGLGVVLIPQSFQPCIGDC